MHVNEYNKPHPRAKFTTERVQFLVVLCASLYVTIAIHLQGLDSRPDSSVRLFSPLQSSTEVSPTRENSDEQSAVNGTINDNGASARYARKRYTLHALRQLHTLLGCKYGYYSIRRLIWRSDNSDSDTSTCQLRDALGYYLHFTVHCVDCAQADREAGALIVLLPIYRSCSGVICQCRR